MGSETTTLTCPPKSVCDTGFPEDYYYEVDVYGPATFDVAVQALLHSQIAGGFYAEAFGLINKDNKLLNHLFLFSGIEHPDGQVRVYNYDPTYSRTFTITAYYYIDQ